MRRIFYASLLAFAATVSNTPGLLAQVPGCATGGYGAATTNAGNYGGAGYGGESSGGGYYRQSLYGGSPAPFGPFGFAMRMYPLIHFHGPLVNYGPYEGYYPFQPDGPWTSDLKYNGPPIPNHPHFANRSASTGGIWGSPSLGWGNYSLATLRNIGLRTHPFKHRCSTCSASAGTTSDVVAVSNVVATPVVRER